MNDYLKPGLKNLLLLSLTVVAILIFYACANVVAPTGGPKDEDPPKVIRSTPPNFSINFKDDQIRIFFDEFVRLHNIRQQLLVSPPLETTPEVRVRGRSIIVDIEEELRQNTTYNFFFGDAIRDITEGNAIPNFQFVFSTGDYVDSLSVHGTVLNAFNLEPEEGVYVMLYDNVYDSVPYLERPVYLAKTDKEGRFRITNMADGEYLMFGLRDKNSNFKYDLPDEKIAFIDSLVTPEFVPLPLQQKTADADSAADTEIAPGTRTPGGDAILYEETPSIEFVDELINDQVNDKDTLTDTLIADLSTHYTLYLFRERDTVQRVTSSALTKRGLITIVFRVPYDSAYVREIQQPFDDEWHIPEFTPNKDTLKIWFADTGRDSLFLEVRDRGRVLDTIARSTTPRVRRDRQETDTVPALQVRMNYQRAQAVPFFKPLSIISEHPLKQINHNKIELLAHDSIPEDIQFHKTGAARRIAQADTLPEEGTRYTIRILPGAFTDIFGLTNDTIQTQFRTTTRENHGSLIINLELQKQKQQYILQLLDRDQKILQEKLLWNDGKYTFKHLDAATYKLRLVHDKNSNGRWDTGNYLEKIQPEPVFMFDENIQIRENWDVEVNWNINISPDP